MSYESEISFIRSEYKAGHINLTEYRDKFSMIQLREDMDDSLTDMMGKLRIIENSTRILVNRVRRMKSTSPELTSKHTHAFNSVEGRLATTAGLLMEAQNAAGSLQQALRQ